MLTRVQKAEGPVEAEMVRTAKFPSFSRASIKWSFNPALSG
jgi:hypothetical protein